MTGRRLIRWLGRSRADADHAREFESFVEIETGENIARGMSPGEARRAALLKFGNPTALREEVYEMNGISFMDTLTRDVRYAVRVLRSSPTFTLVSLLTLAIGIGATTAIFTVVNGVILQPLPYREPSRLATIWEANPRYNFAGMPSGSIAFSPGDFLDLREQSQSFEQTGAFSTDTFTLKGGSGPEGAASDHIAPDRSAPDRIKGAMISAGFLSVLGVRPAIGRPFTQGDDTVSAQRVAIISHSLWTERFGASGSAIGGTLSLNDQPYTIVGVMPTGFRPFNQDIDIWLPIERTLSPKSMRWRYSYYVRVIGRLKSGVSIEQARQDTDRVMEGIRRRVPDHIEKGGVVVPLLDNTIAHVRTPLFLFLGAVGFVLLIACANVANLNLARAITRKREIALRLALGAGRGGVVRQLFTESLLLALIGSLVGLALAEWGVRTLLRLAPSEIPRATEIHIDGWALGFTILAAAACAVIFGLWQALSSANSDPQQGIKAGDRASSAGPSARTARSALVICEIALALVLMIGAGLMIESFRRISAVDPGFDSKGLITMRVALSPARFDTPEKQRLFYQRVVDSLREMPDMKFASAIDGLPFTDGGFDNTFVIDDRPAIPNQPLFADIRRIDPGYFATMGIPIAEGRDVSETDRAGAPPALIINASMARKHWPHESAVGKRITIYFGPPGGIHGEIVGVAGDVRSALDSLPNDFIYLPYQQGANVGQMDLVLRPKEGSAGAAAIARAVRTRIASIDPDQPVYRLHTMEDMLSISLATRSFDMLLLTIFAAISGCLAAIGLYGVLAYSVQSRRKEIGIRTALGARHGQVLGLILRNAMKLTVAGLIAGVLGALALTRLLANLLYGVKATDPSTFIIVSVLLLMVAALAGYLPARRAARIDPLTALRQD